MKIIKALLLILAVVVLAAGGLVGYLTLTEYRPDDIEQLEVTQAARSDNVRVGERLDVLTFNTGYCGLGRDQDFFMDGGTMVRPENEQIVHDNMNGILSELARQDADIYLLQEVDFDSYRSYYVNQADTYRHGLSLNMAVAYNYKCDFVPFPWPPLGKVESGLVTFTDLNVTQATRESLPVPFTWPMRVA
ncbi:MAG: endonuclease, partial [Candidatus Limiplasma sp.]|nr:endonuclease [Candidatus Limiplasma sp.]